MKGRKYGLAALLFSFSTVPLWALANGEDQGGFPHILEAQAVELTHTVINQLITKGELETGWREGVVASASLEQTLLGPEWKIVVVDPAKNADSGQSLHVFFSAEGEYLGANFTGD